MTVMTESDGRHRPPRTYAGGWHAKVGGTPPTTTGMTLVEVMIASTLLIVLLTLVMVTMDMINTVSNSVSAQYQAEYHQALPAFGPLQNLLPRRGRARALPSPACRTPGFASVGQLLASPSTPTSGPPTTT